MSYISASQIETYDEGCNRFWWFQRILKLSEPPASHFTFGTVTHAVNERYLSADKNQRVPGPAGTIVADGPLEGQIGGQPVNLYPKGWDTATERDGSSATVTQPEARLIKKLVAESIENGVLRWREGTQVERKLLAQIIKGVQLIGYVDAYKGPTDVQALPLIEDHKTYGKGSLRYLKREDPKSPNYLGKNQQLKTYCYAIAILDGWDGDMTVRHNQYPKFPGKEVTAVETVITAEQIVEHGEYLKDVAERMERTRKIKEWADVPGPTDAGKCARWYGKPCPFSDICGRAETPDAYKARLERLKSGSPAARLNLPLAKPKSRSKAKEATSMSIFDRANNQKKKRSARKEAAGTKEARAAVPEVEEVPVNGATPEPVEVVAGGAPWSNPDCKACKGRGLTSKNKACPICDNTAKRGKRPTSMAYILEITDEGTGIAAARAESEAELEAAGMPLDWTEGEAVSAPESAPEPAAEEEAPVVAEEPEYEEAPEEEPQPEPKPKARKRRRTKAQIAADAEPDEAPPEPETPAEPAPRKRKAGAGRPKVGLTIMVGAVYLKGQPGGRTVITSDEALARFGAELAADMGAESFYELDSFKRRDRLKQKADYIASELARHILVHPGNLSPHDDASALVNGLIGLDEGIDAVIGRIA